MRLFDMEPSSPNRPKKKKVDYGALCSEFMRLPHMRVETARCLLDMGFQHLDEMAGRCPEALFQDALKKWPNLSLKNRTYFRMLVYYAENENPDPQMLHPLYWQD